MKRRLPLLFLLCASLTAQAQQTDFKQRLQVGASYGMNFSSVSFAPYKVIQTMQKGHSVGATIRWTTEKYLGLQAELNFTQAGWKEEFDDPKYAYSRTLNYLELPLLTHIYFGEGFFTGFINLGPKIGYFLSENEFDRLHGDAPNKTNEQHNMPVEVKFDWGVMGGLGMEMRTPIGSFLLEGRYYYALGNIYKARKEDFFSKSSSQIISAKLTYLFSIF